MNKTNYLVTNFRIQELENCNFHSCSNYTTSVPRVSFFKPDIFHLGSSLHAKKEGKLDDFENFINVAKEILGSNYERQRAAFYNAKLHGNTGFIPHRLIYLEDRLLYSIEGRTSNPPKADFIALCEIGTIKFLLDKFKTNPAWVELTSEIANPTSFAHHLISLIYIYVNRLRGNDVDFLRSNKSESKQADIVQRTPLKDIISVEVKAPIDLWHLNANSEIDAKKIIQKIWKKSRGQRFRKDSIIVVGGMYLSTKQISALKKAAQELFEDKKNEFVLMIQLYSFSVTLKNVRSVTPLALGKQSSMSPNHKLDYAINPYYAGKVTLAKNTREVKGLANEPNSSEYTFYTDDFID